MVKYHTVTVVAKEHIARGIQKYEGKIDDFLTTLSRNTGIQYTVYKFKDNRILLVLPNEVSAILYASEEVFYEHVDLSK